MRARPPDPPPASRGVAPFGDTREWPRTAWPRCPSGSSWGEGSERADRRGAPVPHRAPLGAAGTAPGMPPLPAPRRRTARRSGLPPGRGAAAAFASGARSRLRGAAAAQRPAPARRSRRHLRAPLAAQLTCAPQLLHGRHQLSRLPALLCGGRGRLRRPGAPPARPGAARAPQGLGGAQGHGGRRRVGDSAPRRGHGPGPAAAAACERRKARL